MEKNENCYLLMPYYLSERGLKDFEDSKSQN
jgi:hypothetical protein